MTNALFWLMTIGIVGLIAIALSLGGTDVAVGTGPSRVLW